MQIYFFFFVLLCLCGCLCSQTEPKVYCLRIEDVKDRWLSLRNSAATDPLYCRAILPSILTRRGLHPTFQTDGPTLYCS